jgi:hypothetical protein
LAPRGSRLEEEEVGTIEPPGSVKSTSVVVVVVVVVVVIPEHLFERFAPPPLPPPPPLSSPRLRLFLLEGCAPIEEEEIEECGCFVLSGFFLRPAVAPDMMGVSGGNSPSSTLIANALGIESQLRPFTAVHFLLFRFYITVKKQQKPNK